MSLRKGPWQTEERHEPDELRENAPDDREGVSEEVVEAVELAERLRDTGFRALQPDALLVRAELERLRGDEAARQHALQEAHRILVEIGATARAARVAQEMRG